LVAVFVDNPAAARIGSRRLQAEKRRGVVKRASILAAVGLSLIACGHAAKAGDQMIGNWVISAADSPFDEGGRYYAITFDHGTGFAVRCLEKNLSLAYNVDSGHKFTTGDEVNVKLRTDLNPIVEATGFAINDEGLIAVDTTPEVVRMIRDGKETAIRQMTGDGASTVHVFINNKAAFARVAKECNVDQK
jgi:hypothetical protein